VTAVRSPSAARPEPRLDVSAVRAQFPALRQEVHGKPLVYLDSAATSQKPQCVIDEVARFYREDNSNVHRGVHLLSERATADYERAREVVARHLNAASDREIVFVRGTTEAINLVASSFVRPRMTAGDEVVITTLEHHSNIVPWQLLCEATGAALRVVPMSDAGELELDGLGGLLGPRTRFMSLSHVSNALGTINPVGRMVAMARERGIPVMLDGAQAVPHLPVDVRALGCDFYAFSGHKVYAPMGIGALWGRAEHLEAMPPWQGGGDMIASVSFEKTTYNRVPYKFEAGTPHVPGATGLRVALEWLAGLDLGAVGAHEHELLEHATRELVKVEGVRIIGTAREKAAVLSFVMEGIHPHDIGTIVDRMGVAIRTGHHCAEPVMRRLGLPATARASFAAYNTHDDVEALARAVREVARILR
jgi:cysteine desulfurase/selenocysteine lyase